MRHRSLEIALLLVGLLGKTVSGQPVTTPLPDPINQLLKIQAPLPESVYDRAEPKDRKENEPAPSDDAPLDRLLKYWQDRDRFYKGRFSGKPTSPSEKISYRFLEAAENDPDLLPRMLLFDLLPDKADVHDRVKALLDQRPRVTGKSDEWEEKSWQDSVREWLILHSRHLRDELVEKSRNLYESDGYIHSERYLQALAKLDWESAKPVLDAHIASGQPRRVALSLTLLYTHALAEHDNEQENEVREKLKKIASDRQSVGYARGKALEALLTTEWAGRDEWYLSLFEDTSLYALQDGRYPLPSLSIPLHQHPEQWLPVITKLIGNKNRQIHNNAVSALAAYCSSSDSNPKDILPLLPWLSDPNWADVPKNVREHLFYRLMGGGVPEAVPGLISIVEKEDGHSLMQSAVRALASYHAPQAGPAIRKALKEKRGDRYDLVNALVQCGVLTDAEKMAALEKYAAHVSRVEGSYGMNYSLVGGDFNSIEWQIGSRLSGDSIFDDFRDTPLNLAAMLLRRIEDLRKEKPDLAKNLLIVIQRWPTPEIFQNLIVRIADGTADDLAIRQTLIHREKLRAAAGSELSALLGREGNAAGIATALLGDQSSAIRILQGKDRAAQLALLACARLLQESLPVQEVAALYQRKDPLLSKAVDHYLESEDSEEARNALLIAHPREAFVTGIPRPSEEYVEWEQKLRNDVLEGKAEQIFGLSQGEFFSAVIRLHRSGGIILRQRDKSREESRDLSSDEVRELRTLLEATNFNSLKPLIYVPPENFHGSLAKTQMLLVNRDGGRRVYTNTLYPKQKGKTPYQQLFNLIERLTQADGFKLRYYLADRIAGLEVLYAADNPAIRYVCLQNGQPVVFVEKQFKGTMDEIIERQSRGIYSDWDWHLLKGDAIGEVTAEPPTCPIVTDEIEPDRVASGSPEAGGAAWQLKLGKDYFRAGILNRRNRSDDRKGLWRLSAGQKPDLLLEGDYSSPVVTRDGKWIVAGKFVWKESNYSHEIVRIDLKTKQEQKTSVPVLSGEHRRVVGEIIDTGKALVCRVTGYRQNEELVDCLLLQIATGKTEKIKGEFHPLQQQTFRSLQATADGKNFWAAIPDRKAKRTQFGVYDTKTFAFTALLDLPEIEFNSMQMWVDEGIQKIYIAYRGHLLRLPLPKQ